MKTIFLFFFLLSSGFVISQSERIVMLDSSIGTYGTVYFLVIGNKLDGKKIGEWNLYQYSAIDTNKFLAASETYDKNVLTAIREYRLDGHTEKSFNKKGELIMRANYRYGNLTWQKEYVNRKKVISRSYYPNGQISGEGPEVLVEIIAGCDAGMRIFQRFGEWIYFDTDGEEMDRQIYTLKKNVYKKV